MPASAVPQSRVQSTGEEIANSVSHGIGLIAALAGVPILIIAAVDRGHTAGIVAAAVFAVSLVLVYLTSTLYHAWPRTDTKHVLRLIDHAAIFLLIAGTYTPFTLGILRGAWGWTLFALVWGLGLSGILLKMFTGARHAKISLTLYITMGWLALIAARPLWIGLGPWGSFWLAAGGVAYTGGVAFYVARRVRYAHFIWHLCVMTGSACHFIAVLRYAG